MRYRLGFSGRAAAAISCSRGWPYVLKEHCLQTLGVCVYGASIASSLSPWGKSPIEARHVLLSAANMRSRRFAAKHERSDDREFHEERRRQTWWYQSSDTRGATMRMLVLAAL